MTYVSRRASRYSRPQKVSWFRAAFGVGLGYGCGVLAAIIVVPIVLYFIVAVLFSGSAGGR